MSADLMAAISNIQLAYIAPVMAALVFVAAGVALPRRVQSYAFSFGLLLIAVFHFATEAANLAGWRYWAMAVGLFFLFSSIARSWSTDIALAGAMLGATIGVVQVLEGSLLQETAARSVFPLTLIGAALAAVFVLSPTIQHWRFRCRIWLREPERLLEPPPRGEYSDATAMVLVVAVLFIAALLPSRWNAVALGIGALAAGGVAHRSRWQFADLMSVGLGGGAFFFLARDWLTMPQWNVVIGFTWAAIFLLWLAQFWHQQLRDHVPWTTSGRLIRPARNIAIFLTFLLPAVVYGPFLRLGRVEVPGMSWGAVIFGLSCFALLRLFARDIRDHASAVAVWCAGFVALSMGFPLATILVRWFPGAPLPPGIAGALLILVLSLPKVSRNDDARVVTNALAFCLLPACLVVSLLSASVETGTGVLFGLCGVLTLIAFGVRSTRMKPASVAL